MTMTDFVEKLAEELFYKDAPTWPKRWGWIEVEEVSKNKYRQMAREELDPIGAVAAARVKPLAAAAPYPWCKGPPLGTVEDCIARGACLRNPGCGD